MRGPQDWLALAFFVLLCLAVSGIAGAVTSTTVGTWYQSLEKPTFNPPDWIFAPVWTVLYFFMAIAGWRVWRSPASAERWSALGAFAVQLALNLAWSFIFFGFQLVGAALLEIIALFLAILITTVRFWRIDRLAGALFAPYLAWVAYATLLNAALWILN